MFQGEDPEGMEMPNFIFLMIGPALVLISHFAGQSSEL